MAPSLRTLCVSLFYSFKPLLAVYFVMVVDLLVSVRDVRRRTPDLIENAYELVARYRGSVIDASAKFVDRGPRVRIKVA